MAVLLGSKKGPAEACGALRRLLGLYDGAATFVGDGRYHSKVTARAGAGSEAVGDG